MTKEILTEKEKELIIQSLDLAINQISGAIIQTMPEERPKLKKIRNEYIDVQSKVDKLETKKI